jgi:hypothetical protein
VSRLVGRWGAVVALACALILVSITGASLLRGQTAGNSIDARDVVDAYVMARKSGDADALTRVFADDAVIVDRLGQAHSGTDELRRQLQISSSRGRALGVSERHQNGDHVFWLEPAATPDSNLVMNVEAVVERGRIRLLVYRGSEAALPGQPQLARNQLPALLGLALPLLLVSVTLAGMSLLTRPVAVATRPRPALLADLRRWTQTRRTGLANGARYEVGRSP